MYVCMGRMIGEVAFEYSSCFVGNGECFMEPAASSFQCYRILWRDMLVCLEYNRGEMFAIASLRTSLVSSSNERGCLFAHE